MELKTEEDIQNEYDHLKQWKEIYGKQIPEYTAKINNWLSDVGRQGREQLIALYHNEEFLQNFMCDPEMAYMQVVISIYEDEIKENTEYTILDGKKTIDEVIQFLLILKFKLWHVEQDFSENSYQEFLDFVRDQHVSVITITYIVHTFSMKKAETLYKLGIIFQHVGMIRYAFVLLKYANEVQPGDRYILEKLAEICLAAGKKDVAEQCLAMIQNDNGEV